MAVDASEIPVDWWEQDLSRWPGPDDELYDIKIGDIVYHKGMKSSGPIGKVMALFPNALGIMVADVALTSSPSGQIIAYRADRLLPYSAG